MEIRIDNELIDFTLENECTLGEVVHGLRQWLEQRSCNIRGISIDGINCDPLASDSLEKRPLGDIGRIDIDSGNLHSQSIQALSAIMDYLDQLLASLNEERLEEASSLLGEAPTVMSSLRLLFPRVFGRESTALDEACRQAAGHDRFDPGRASRLELSEFIAKLGILVRTRLSEALHPELEAISVLRALDLQTGKIQNISVLLQTGRDGEAMRTLVAFSELIDKAMRLYSTLSVSSPARIQNSVDGLSFRSFIDDLNINLKSLVEAFDAHDSVLIGDVLEYEIASRVRTLASFFNFS